MPAFLHPASTLPPSRLPCLQWDHVVQLYVCCNDPGGAAPPCDPCRNTPWSLPTAQAAGADWPIGCCPVLEVFWARRTAAAHLLAPRRGCAVLFTLPRCSNCTLHAAFKPRSLSLEDAPVSSNPAGGGSSGSANVTARAIKDGPDSGLPGAQLVRQCGRELGRWVTPYRCGSKQAGGCRGCGCRAGNMRGRVQV